MNRSIHALSALAAVAALASTRPAAGQCSLQWQAGDPIPYAYGSPRATTLWDPDGAGPTASLLVVGGSFSAGQMLGTSVAAFDGVNWLPLGTPPFADVGLLGVWNGLLIATAGYSGAIATWNGTAWSVIGSTDGRVNTMAVFQGDLYLGGAFTTTNGIQTRRVARWNGTSWSEPGNGVSSEVLTMAVFGSLYVGGSFTQAGPVPVGNLAIWNGTSWSAGPTFNGAVRCLAARTGIATATSYLFAGGDFSMVGTVPAQHVARLTMSTGAWSALPALSGARCVLLHVRNTSLSLFQLHAAVDDNNSAHKVWRLDGSSWTSLGPVSELNSLQAKSLSFFQGRLVVALQTYATSFRQLGATLLEHDGTKWRALCGRGFDDGIYAMAPFGDELIVTGAFRRYGNLAIEHIARGGPGAWQPLGSGLTPNGQGLAVCVMPNGDIVVGGSFTTAGGVVANNVARWNGSAWSSLGSGVNGDVHALLALPNGELIAGGAFTTAGGVAAGHVARWNGVAWTPLGSAGSGIVRALARTSSGDIVAAGNYLTASATQAVARWNGTTWSALGAGLPGFGYALTVLPDDHVVLAAALQGGGTYTPSVVRWDGSAWLTQSVPATGWTDSVFALAALPNGDYFAGGYESGFGTFDFVDVARHTGSSSSLQWTPFDVVGYLVDAAVVKQDGDVAFGGLFLTAGGAASHDLAVLRPTCPAAAAPYGSGCTGSGGANVLAATMLPWIGSTFRARATGMPEFGTAMAVSGFTQIAVPMPSVLPQGVAGCTALVSSDRVDIVVPAAGVVTTQLAVPASMSLAGQVFYHQVWPLETTFLGNAVAATATNGLALTIGVL